MIEYVVDGIDCIPGIQRLYGWRSQMRTYLVNIFVEATNPLAHKLNNLDLELYEIVLDIYIAIEKLIRYRDWNSPELYLLQSHFWKQF